MARGDIIKARLAQRIADSEHEITIHYPPVRPTSTTALSGGMVAPLTGTPSQPKALPEAATPSKPPVTMRCIWFDRTTLQVTADNRSVQQLYWHEPAHAMARVLVDDLAADPLNPGAATIADGCDHIEHNGRRYRVLQTDPISPGTMRPYSYAIWLLGAQKQ